MFYTNEILIKNERNVQATNLIFLQKCPDVTFD